MVQNGIIQKCALNATIIIKTLGNTVFCGIQFTFKKKLHTMKIDINSMRKCSSRNSRKMPNMYGSEINRKRTEKTAHTHTNTSKRFFASFPPFRKMLKSFNRTKIETKRYSYFKMGTTTIKRTNIKHIKKTWKETAQRIHSICCWVFFSLLFFFIREKNILYTEKKITTIKHFIRKSE